MDVHRGSTLLLNASFEPLTVVPLTRAVALVVADIADVIETVDGAVLRSPTTAMPVPVVIRLRRYVKVPYRGRARWSRRGVLTRDRHRCGWCGGKATTVDHIVPRSRGGPDSWENTVASCRRCNGRKGSRLAEELGWTLRTRPTVPVGWTHAVVGVAPVDPAWTPYLMPT